MSTKRQPSKQRRQAENQRQRAALEARRANAAAAGSVPEGKVGAGSAGSGSGSGSGGSLLSRLRGSAATGRAVRTATPGGSQPIGYRAALSALLAGVAGAVVGALLIAVPVDADGKPVTTAGAVLGEWTLSASAALDQDPGATADELVDAVDDWTPNGDEPYGKANFPVSLFLLLPVAGAGLAFRAVSRRAPAKVVNRAMYVTLFGTLLSGQLPIFLPSVVGVGIAAFQVRKAEVQAAAAAADDAAGPADGDGDGEVIDVEEVDEVEADELAEDDSFLDAEDSAEDADGDAQRSV